MNNEPVAWIYQHPDTLQPALKFAEPTTYLATVINTPDIPLYTHPPAQQWTIEAKFKELTDGEIQEISHQYHYTYNPDYVGFARAILRKAQEK